jgi:hypothetical protein
VYLTAITNGDLVVEDCSCQPQEVDSDRSFERDWGEPSGKAKGAIL